MRQKIPLAFERIERALEKQRAAPLFNGAKYSLVDAADVLFLQRYLFSLPHPATAYAPIPAAEGLRKHADEVAFEHCTSRLNSKRSTR